MATIDNQNVLLIGNDNSLELNGLRNAITDAYVNDAMVAAVLKDMAGIDLPGQPWPLVLPYVAASDGCYRGILQDTLTLKHDQHYRLQIAAQGDGLTATWEAVIKAEIRRK
ncbi:MAG: hypothetical protein ABL903_08440 [Methylococcales bacterium]